LADSFLYYFFPKKAFYSKNRPWDPLPLSCIALLETEVYIIPQHRGVSFPEIPRRVTSWEGIGGECNSSEQHGNSCLLLWRFGARNLTEGCQHISCLSVDKCVYEKGHRDVEKGGQRERERERIWMNEWMDKWMDEWMTWWDFRDEKMPKGAGAQWSSDHTDGQDSSDLTQRFCKACLHHSCGCSTGDPGKMGHRWMF
jgi:hypothetical protein